MVEPEHSEYSTESAEKQGLGFAKLLPLLMQVTEVKKSVIEIWGKTKKIALYCAVHSLQTRHDGG